ncbi:MAG: OsmC family protein [Dehalococcoidia bacterium]
MPRVEADFQDRKRIVFSARGRSSVNVRESLEDGPIGYSSTELLLIALANCQLGTLLGHELLKDANVVSATAALEAGMAPDPPRVATVDVDVKLVVTDSSILAHHAELEAATCGCPMCNSVNSAITVRLAIEVASPVAALA